MKRLKNSCAILILVVFLTIFAIQDENGNLMVVQGTVTPTLESDIVIGIDMAHGNNISVNQITNLTALLNSTFSSTQIVFLTENLNTGELEFLNVLIVLAPTVAYSESEIEDVEEFIRTGNSLLIATDYMNQTTEHSNDLINVFGLSFNLSSSIIPNDARNNLNYYEYLARNFTTPITPITENISQIVFPNGLGMSFNGSKLDTYNSPAITNYNPILLMNSLAGPSENNTMASSLEFENGARIIALGSVDMFNNSYIEPLENTTSTFMDNTDFLLNSIKWLGRNTGIMNFFDSWTDQSEASIKLGEIISGNVTLVDSNHEGLTQSQIFITLERTGSILRSRIMSVDPTNSSRFYGSINTEGLSSGYCDVVFIANRIGYLPIEVTAGRIYLEGPFPSPQLPNPSLWGLLAAIIIIFASTAVLIRMNFKN
ncbi:MAG: hypothetical protein ACW99Q_20420 [Candidatus Kariarchaeaceae archaeon]